MRKNGTNSERKEAKNAKFLTEAEKAELKTLKAKG
jgi:hypothetical protein